MCIRDRFYVHNQRLLHLFRTLLRTLKLLPTTAAVIKTAGDSSSLVISLTCLVLYIAGPKIAPFNTTISPIVGTEGKNGFNS